MKNIFTTERLYARFFDAMNKEDVRFYYNLSQDPEISEFFFLEERPLDNLSSAYQAMIDNQYVMVCDKDTDTPIGIVDFRKSYGSGNVGCAFIESCRGKGYASEIMDEMIDLLFREYGCKDVYTYIVPHNNKSHHILEKQGFRPLGIYVNEYYCIEMFNNRIIMYRITRDEYIALNNKNKELSILSNGLPRCRHISLDDIFAA